MKTIVKMKTKLLTFGCAAILLAISGGCSKDNPLNPAGNCFGGLWAEQYTDELRAWSNALAAYNEEPNKANCDDYKNAAKAYLDAIDAVYECVPTASRAEIDQAITEAKADIDQEGCN